MAYICDICGKGKQYGHNVPFSQKKTNKVWKPNLQKVRLTIGGTRIQVKACAQCLRTLAKYQKQAAVTVAETPIPPTPETEKPKAAAKKPAARKTTARRKAPAKASS